MRIVGGDDTFHAGHPAWSPDGRSIAFTGGPGDHPAVGLYDVATGALSWVVGRRRSTPIIPVWSPDGDALAFLVDSGVETGLRHLDLRDGQVRELSLGHGNHYAPRFTPDGTALYVVLSGPGQPADLFRVRLPHGHADPAHVRRCPRSSPTTTSRAAWQVRYRSLDHLAEVPALLVEPDEPNGAGVVIIHGGPTWHHSNEWDALRQAFVGGRRAPSSTPTTAAATATAARWQLANRYLMGQGEAWTAPAAHAFLVALGCDPARIACTGRSWGGFLTMAMVTQFPELWAAGVAGVPFFDFIDSAHDPAVREDLRWWDLQNTRRPRDRDRRQARRTTPRSIIWTASRRRCCCSAASWTRAARRGSCARWPRRCGRAARSARPSSTRTKATRSAASSIASTTTSAPWSSSSSTSA